MRGVVLEEGSGCGLQAREESRGQEAGRWWRGDVVK